MRFTLSRGALDAAVQTRGGELVSLRRNGAEYIWGGDPAFWSGQNPILFPIVGSLKDGQVDIGGRAPSLPPPCPGPLARPPPSAKGNQTPRLGPPGRKPGPPLSAPSEAEPSALTHGQRPATASK